MTIQLTLGVTDNLRMQPLVDGSVKLRNIDLNFVVGNPTELAYRQLKYDEFDASEMSISDTLIALERDGTEGWEAG